MSAEWLAVAMLAGGGWLWWDSLRKRELALRAARNLCVRAGVQLLDETVAMKRMRLRRNADLRLSVHRTFVVEYTDTGDNRLPGRVELLGDQLLAVDLEAGVF